MFALAAVAQTPDKPPATPDKPAGSAPDAKPAGNDKADAPKADDKKPDAKADDKKADEAKAGDKKPDAKADEAKAGEQKPDAKADEKKADEAKAGDEKKAGDAKAGDAKAGQPAAAGAAGAGAGTAGAGAAGAAGAGAGAGAAAGAGAGAGAPPAPTPPVAAAPSTAPAAAPAAVPPAAPQPAMAASAPPAQDQGAGSGASKAPLPPPEKTFGIELDAGTNARLDGASPGFNNHEAADITFGGGLWFAPARLYSLGLSFQRAGIGSETSSPVGSSVAVTRDLNTLWIGGRAYPLRNDKVGLYIALNLGASWQHVDATGATVTQQYTTPAQPFACSATQGPGFAIGGGVGADVDLDRHLAFLVGADISAHRLSSDPADLGGCAPGSGSVTNLAARIGFMYRFDLGGSDNKESASSGHLVQRF